MNEPLCVCGHSMRKHMMKGVFENRCKRSKCGCHGYQPKKENNGLQRNDVATGNRT